ncbi:ENDO3c domain-containing protein [Forsythia ovata]|uniref:ENDO3c domain-containing protein n=1 Tax=Forsythia ovata TaxID=205694 RepID=A0ABD1U6P5_9LAMI
MHIAIEEINSYYGIKGGKICPPMEDWDEASSLLHGLHIIWPANDQIIYGDIAPEIKCASLVSSADSGQPVDSLFATTAAAQAHREFMAEQRSRINFISDPNFQEISQLGMDFPKQNILQCRTDSNKDGFNVPPKTPVKVESVSKKGKREFSEKATKELRTLVEKDLAEEGINITGNLEEHCISSVEQCHHYWLRSRERKVKSSVKTQNHHYWLRSSERKVKSSVKNQNNAKNPKHRDLLVSAAASTLPGGRNGRKGIKIEVDIGLRNTPKPETPDPAARENMPEKKKLLSEDEVVQLTNSSSELENEQYTRTGKEAGVKSCRRSLNFGLKGEEQTYPVLDQEYENYVHSCPEIVAKSSVRSFVYGHDVEMDEKVCGTDKIGSSPVLLHVYQRKRKCQRPVWNKSTTMDQKSYTCSTSSAVMCTEGPLKRVEKEMIKPIHSKSRHPRLGNTSRKSKMFEKNGKITDKEHGMLVTYEETLHLTTELQSTARGQLDKRTMRECKVLVENIDFECSEEADKWWEQERGLFFERVKLFIFRMHLIQGNRQFSQWKGSVIDSIVGAFLTQNVKDNVSSSAFMSLAAKYPHGAIEENSSPETSIGSSSVRLNGRNRSRSSDSDHKNNNFLPSLKQSSTSKKEQIKIMRTKEGMSKKTKDKKTKLRRKRATKENFTINWAKLKKIYSKGNCIKKSGGTSDAVDWEAVRNAEVEEISKIIEKRGMNNNLATRIKNFLDILAKELGSTDLEWLRDVPHQEAKEYLLSIPGLGLKSVECVRLLTLLQPAFPIDTNAGRIAVRLGWVPIQPLPEEEKFHLLKQYPKIDTVQKYLWPRLSKLDPLTLYELHCQMITLGKVFCTKRDPNCNSCPLREECKHFKSSSARQLPLPGIHEKSEMQSKIPMPLAVHPPAFGGTSTVSLLEANFSKLENFSESEPLLESSSRQIIGGVWCKSLEFKDRDMEDFGFHGLPGIRLNNHKLKEKIQKFSYNDNIPFQGGEMTITPEIATTPLNKLWNAKCSRTDHQVYVLPDSHSILAKLPKREPNDLCPYLLAIWTQEGYCDLCNSENLNKDQPLSCLDVPGEDSVYGTLLVPSRTAMRGCFPLNGTFFQVNEVFADDESSDVPIKVSRTSILDLRQTTLYCGTTISAIFKGMKHKEVEKCFWTGFICLRGFDRETREPKLLHSRFHHPVTNLKENGGRRKRKVEEMVD